MNPPKAPSITPEETVVVNLDELSLPATPTDSMTEFINQNS